MDFSKSILQQIIDTLPAHIYWTDKDTRIIGANLAQAINFGYNDVQSCIGKDTYDFAKILGWDKETADQLHKEHLEIIRTGVGKMLENTLTLADGTKHTYLSYKYPLIADGKVTGFVGISVDITDRKRVEKLELEKEAAEKTAKATEMLLHEQEKFKQLASQVVHDIRSPLASLLMIVKSCEKDLPEDVRIILRETAINIGDIANNLLSKYKKEETDGCEKTEVRQPIMVALVLLQLLTDKKYQYKKLSIKFDHNFCRDCNFAFIKAEPIAFKRMISNLINNSVDALAEKEGQINLSLDVKGEKLIITIEDNGKGMSQEVVDKIMHKIAVTKDKKEGHGIGLIQVQDTLQHNQGELVINSQVGKGTKIILTFPLVELPEWVAKQIELHKGDTVVILDDDSSIHGAWEMRFKNYAKDVHLVHFASGGEAINYINSFPEKDKIFLLTDFELLKQELNGLHVIKQTNMKRSILVTSHFSNQIVRDLAAETETKILPKQLASEVPIKIGQNNKHMPSNLKKVDVVIIEDDCMLADALAYLLEGKSKIVDKYYNPLRFLENVDQYAKDTKVCMDNSFGGRMTGIELAQLLHEAGFTQLYLFSGTDFPKEEVPSYLTVVSKTDTDALYELLGVKL